MMVKTLGPGYVVLRWVVVETNGIVALLEYGTVLRFEYSVVLLEIEGNLGSVDRRWEEPLSRKGGSLIGSEPVVAGTGHDAAG